ncbi:hypothetical protein HDU67_001126 [Dinochytrium kinnereticum]|nr:hypothetical protein HDU67_001126 [Dinochytrium kinnereticum]
MRCFDWSPEYSSHSSIFAIGHATGRTTIGRFYSDIDDEVQFGVDVLYDAPARTEHSLYVLNVDIAKLTSTPSSANPFLAGNQERPVFQSGYNDAVSSAAWLPDEVGGIIAGMGGKWVRIFDLRKDNGSTSIVIATKSVFGLSVDPFNPTFFASYFEDTVSVWDKRKTAEPAFKNQTIVKMDINLSYLWGFMGHVSKCINERSCVEDGIDYALAGIEGIMAALKSSRIASVKENWSSNPWNTAIR